MGVLWIGISGIHRSLWLDEAWVANSLRQESLKEMFWGGEWLQTSPPLFLLLSRAWIGLAGLTTENLRTVPLLFALCAAVFAQLAASAAGARQLAPLLAAVLMFQTAGVEYFASFKQYGAEAAAVCALLWAAASFHRDKLPWYWLAAIMAGLLTLAYPVAFLIPGILLLVLGRAGWSAAISLGAACALVLATMYVGFIRPNLEPSLWTYWGTGLGDSYSLPVWAWVAASAALTGYSLYRRNFLLLACALPPVLLVAAELTGWYPASPRMRLFVRPCFLLALALAAAPLLKRLDSRKSWITGIASIAAVTMTVFGAVRFNPEPFEDYRAALHYLREHAQADDLVLVHADARQGALLYSAIENWTRNVKFGDTGWPCCARGREVKASSEAAVRADLDRLIPKGYRGRVWLVYANRPLHWEFLGLDEGDLWRRAVWERGCPPGEYVELPNLVISPMDCKSP